MRVASSVVAIAAASLLCQSACSSSKPNTCVPGQSAACVGQGNCNGFQVCNAQGTFGSCVCQGNDAGSGQDAGSGNDGGGSTDAGNRNDAGAGDAGACTTFTAMTIPAMRAGTSACVQLDNVVSLGSTPGAGFSNMFVQDADGGAYSAMMAQCNPANASHPCSVLSTVQGIPEAELVTIQGQYVKNAVPLTEQFFISSVTDEGAALSVPGAAGVTLSSIQRGSSAFDTAFQLVQANISGGNTLVMYDWSPAEFSVPAATTCPFQLGFGMLPMTAGGTPGAACTNRTSQPSGQPANAQEVLIGDDFQPGYTISSDCQCSAALGQTAPTAASQVTGTIQGFLVFSAVPGSNSTYFYLAPRVVSDLPLSATATVPP